MTLDNGRTIINLRIKLFFATILLIAWLIVVYAAELINFPLLGFSDTIWTVAFVAVYIIIALMPMVRNVQYVSFSDEEDHLVFRYFFAGIVGGKKNSISISKKSFSGYKYEKKFFGLKRSLILFQKIGQGVAKYPPIYITALNKDQRTRLFNTLNQHNQEV